MGQEEAVSQDPTANTELEPKALYTVFWTLFTLLVFKTPGRLINYIQLQLCFSFGYGVREVK